MKSKLPESLAVLIYNLLLGTLVPSLVGAVGALLTVIGKRDGVLLSLIRLPLYIPVLILGANAIDVASDRISVRGQRYLPGAVLVLALSLASLTTAVALRLTASRQKVRILTLLTRPKPLLGTGDHRKILIGEKL